MHLRVRVLLFGRLRLAAGARELDLEVSENATGRELLDQLCAVYEGKLAPMLRDQEGRPLVSIAADGRIVEMDEPLREGNTITLLLPLGGG